MRNDKIETIDFVLYKTIRTNLNSKEKDFLITEDLQNSKKYYEILNSIVQLIKTINKTKVN